MESILHGAYQFGAYRKQSIRASPMVGKKRDLRRPWRRSDGGAYSGSTIIGRPVVVRAGGPTADEEEDVVVKTVEDSDCCS